MPAKRFPSAREWIDSHPAEYEQLFDNGELNLEEFRYRLASSSHIALSALARFNKNRASLPFKEQYAALRDNVNRILNTAQDGAYGLEHAFVHNASIPGLYALKCMTSQVVSAWQRGYRHFRPQETSPLESLFDSRQELLVDTVDKPPIKVVLMASAALHSLSKDTTRYPKNIISARVIRIARYGPNDMHTVQPENERPAAMLNPDFAAALNALETNNNTRIAADAQQGLRHSIIAERNALTIRRVKEIIEHLNGGN